MPRIPGDLTQSKKTTAKTAKPKKVAETSSFFVTVPHLRMGGAHVPRTIKGGRRFQARRRDLRRIAINQLPTVPVENIRWINNSLCVVNEFDQLGRVVKSTPIRGVPMTYHEVSPHSHQQESRWEYTGKHY